jgi:putative transposase
VQNRTWSFAAAVVEISPRLELASLSMLGIRAPRGTRSRPGAVKVSRAAMPVEHLTATAMKSDPTAVGMTIVDGVREVAEHVWLISFMNYDLGFFDHESNRFECAESLFAAKVLPMSSE